LLTTYYHNQKKVGINPPFPVSTSFYQIKGFAFVYAKPLIVILSYMKKLN
jgi:hypothetical protein